MSFWLGEINKKNYRAIFFFCIFLCKPSCSLHFLWIIRVQGSLVIQAILIANEVWV